MVVLLMGLFGALVVHLTAMRHGVELNEGALRLESLLRFARAEAALNGKRIRIEFQIPPPAQPWQTDSPPPEPVRLSREPEPLRRPGLFTPLHPVQWADHRLGDLVAIEEVRWPERPVDRPDTNVIGGLDDLFPSAWPVTADDDAASPEIGTTDALIFDSEGSAESVELLVRSVDPADTRRVLITVQGLTGRVTRRWLDADESDDPSATEPQRSGADPGVVEYRSDMPETASGRAR